MSPVTRYEGPEVVDDSQAASLPKDQTVFIRAYKAALRYWLGPKVMQAAAEPRSPGRDDPEDGSGWAPSSGHPFGHESRDDSEGTITSTAVVSMPQLSQHRYTDTEWDGIGLRSRKRPSRA